MKWHHIILGAATLGTATPSHALRTEMLPPPLPAKTDIPADMGGVVVCPDLASAQIMYDDYFQNKEGSSQIDLDLFFAGIKATGCTQTSGPMTISFVNYRKKLADGSYIQFAGVMPDGKTFVSAIVNEDANNRFSRTDLERWLYPRGENDMLKISEYDRQVYRCPTAKAARAAVTAIAENGLKTRQVKALRAAVRKQKCGLITIGTFKVTAVHESRWIIHGEEDGQEWTALTVIDENGKTIGLVYDGALI